MIVEKLLKQYGTAPCWSNLTFRGVDVSLDTSLLEYYLVWAYCPDGQIRFVIRVPREAYDTPNTFRMDWAAYSADLDPYAEWDWVDWDGFFETLGIDKEEWETFELGHRVFDLYKVFGHASIFGAYNYVDLHCEADLTDDEEGDQDTIPSRIKAALLHVRSIFPDVTMVVFNVAHQWRYMTDDFEPPSFFDNAGVSTHILEQCERDIDEFEIATPCVFRLNVVDGRLR